MMVLVWRIADDSPNSPNFPTIWYLANVEQELDIHHSTDSNNSTCTQVHNTAGIKMI